VRAQVAGIPAKLGTIGYEFAPTDDWDADLFQLTQEQVETSPVWSTRALWKSGWMPLPVWAGS
jgi:hypothetical protein